MAETTILSRRPRPRAYPSDTPSGMVDLEALVFDAVVTEHHQHASQVTDHPVEEGAPVTDHVRPLPDVLTMEIVVSNTPLEPIDSRIVESGGVRWTTTAFLDAPRGAPGAMVEAYQQLLGWRGRLMTVVTGLRTYDSMVIADFSAPRDKTTGEALRATVVFRRVRVVKNKFTRTVVAKDKRAGDKVKTGAQSTEVEKSAAYDLAEMSSKAENKTLKGIGNFFLRAP